MFRITFVISLVATFLIVSSEASAQKRFLAYSANNQVQYAPKAAGEPSRQYLEINKELITPNTISNGDIIVVEHESQEYDFRVKKIASYFNGTYTIVATTGSRYLYFTYTGDVATASIQIPDVDYEGIISYDPNLKMSYLYEHDHSNELSCELDQFHDQMNLQIDSKMESIRVNNSFDPLKKTQNINSSTTIALMIVYANGAQTWMNSKGGANNVINTAMTLSQEALDVSNTQIVLDLVHVANVNYNEAGVSSSNILDYLQKPSDGIMDEVHTWRNTYEADIVSILVDVEDTGGLGYIITDPGGIDSFAFNLNRVKQIDFTYTLAHEIGHNLGNNHSRNQAAAPAPASGGVFTYSTGWRWIGTDAKSYASVMTYETSPLDGVNSTRTPHFSNPSINFQGTPTGTASSSVPYGPADNARSMREMKDVTAAYRPITGSTTPLITSLNPTTALRGTQVTVQFTGQRFNTVTNVSWSCLSAGALTAVSATINSSVSVTIVWNVSATATLGACNVFFTSPAGNSNTVQLTIVDSSPSLPTVTTATISSIGTTSATGGGNVTSDGGASVTARGVCYATTQNPTTSNSCVSSGTGTGSFTANLTGLNPSTLYYVRAYATNSAGTAYGSQVSFTTNAASTAPTVTTAAVSSIGTTTATAGGNVTSDGGASVTARGVCYATTPNPTTSDSCVSSGSGTGAFTANLTSLSSGTTYNVRAYATNTAGTSYGSQVSFTTDTPSVAPTVTTASVSSITTNSATAGGNVTSQGSSAVTARGVCYATTPNPTTADSCVSSGSGTGAFTANLTSLSSGTTYNVRAYATNTAGTSYGSQVSFTTDTPSVAPTVTTASVSSITTNSATAGGNVTSQGSSAVTARGVCYATTPNPTTSDSCVSSGSGTGAFTANLTSLSSGTTYNVRAYATNTAGTSYGSQLSFTTTTPIANRAPTINPLQNISFLHSISGPLSIQLSGITAGAGESGQSISVTARSSDPLLIPFLQVDYTSPQSTGTLRIQNNRTRVGSATISVRVKDDGGVANGGVDSVLVSFVANVILDTNLEDDVTSPQDYRLDQNYPNPFNPSTKITFQIPSREMVSLSIYDTMGRQRLVLVDAELSAGTHTVTLDASTLPSGIYMYVLNTRSFTTSRKMTLIK